MGRRVARIEIGLSPISSSIRFLLLFVALIARPVAAQTIVANFVMPPASPFAGLLLRGSSLYGTTVAGGPTNQGTLFRIDPSTGVTTVLASFTGANGAKPMATLIANGDFLYGTTSKGGANDEGTVFRANPLTGEVTTLVSFDRTNGAEPAAELLVNGSYLYGTTLYGGANDDGTVFKIDPETGNLTTVVSFDGANGKNPFAGLVLFGGFLYGATTSGGASQRGTIYWIDPLTGVMTVVSSLGEANLSYPDATLEVSGPYLYGTTKFGGTNFAWGAVFRLDPSTGVVTTLASFDQQSGTNAAGGLLANGPYLYGTTTSGGNGGSGTLYRLDPSTSSLNVVVSFNRTNGFQPHAKPTLYGSFLYGTTGFGGSNDLGTVFRVDSSTGELTTLTAFAWEGGLNPQSELVAHGSYLYGTARNGGANGYGAIYRIDPSTDTLTTLASFGFVNGARPMSGLTVSGPLLYGTTSWGGAYGRGTAYRFDPSTNALSLLTSFGNGTGTDPEAGLTANGPWLYGTTPFGTLGNNAGLGTIYRIDSSTGSFSTLTWFQQTNGNCPRSELLAEGPYLYGTTQVGGANDLGSVFRFDSATGTLITLASFDKATTGAAPTAGLVRYGAHLYGTTRGITTGQGSDVDGTVFRIDPATGTLSSLVTFKGPNGLGPRSSMVLNGSYLYGTTEGGGAHGDGTVFKFDPATGQLTTLVSFDSRTTGSDPYARLVVYGSYLYGTTSFGGKGGGGTVFKLNLAEPSITNVTPAIGPTGGAQTVTISGTALDGAAVTIAGQSATISSASENAITVMTPAHSSGVVDIIVTTPVGSATATNGYTYAAAPSITSVQPAIGINRGGESITINGANFFEAKPGTVTFGGVPILTFTASSSTSLSFITPAHAIGPVDIAITQPGGTVTSPGAYTYVGNTTTSLTSGPGPFLTGDTVNLTATVSATSASGTVTLKDGTIAIASRSITNGAVTFPVSILGPGSHSIVAAYDGVRRIVGNSDSMFAYASAFGGLLCPMIRSVTKAGARLVLVAWWRRRRRRKLALEAIQLWVMRNALRSHGRNPEHIPCRGFR